MHAAHYPSSQAQAALPMAPFPPYLTPASRSCLPLPHFLSVSRKSLSISIFLLASQ